MSVLALARNVLAVEYSVVRYPVQLLEAKVVAPRLAEEHPLRVALGRVLSGLDSAAGRLGVATPATEPAPAPEPKTAPAPAEAEGTSGGEPEEDAAPDGVLAALYPDGESANGRGAEAAAVESTRAILSAAVTDLEGGNSVEAG